MDIDILIDKLYKVVYHFDSKMLLKDTTLIYLTSSR